MKMKRFISAVAALAMSVSCFAGLAITANAEDPVVKYTRATGTEGGANVWSSTDLVENGTASDTAWIRNDTENAVWAVTASDGISYEMANNTAGATNSSIYTTSATKSIANLISKNDLIRFTGTIKTPGANGQNAAYEYVKLGSNIELQASPQAQTTTIIINGNSTSGGVSGRSATISFDVTVDTAMGTVTSFKLNNTEKLAQPVSYGDATFTSVTFGHNRHKSENTTWGTRTAYLSNFAVATTAQEAAATAGYTVNFVDNNNQTLKESQTGTIAVGVGLSTVLATDDLKDYKTGSGDNEKKYIYVSNDAGDKVATATDSENVVNITYREAEKYAIKVVPSITTGATKSFLDKNVFEKDEYSYAFPWYLTDDDGKVIAVSDGKSFSKTETATEDKTVTVPYTAYDPSADNAIVTYFKDFNGGANLEGAAFSGGSAMRASDNADSPTVLMTVPENGVYTVKCYYTADSAARKPTITLEKKDGKTADVTQIDKVVDAGVYVTNFQASQPLTGTDLTLNKGDIIQIHTTQARSGPDFILLEKTAEITPTAEVKDEALFQPVNPATGEQETVSFDTLIGEDTLATKTIAVTIYDSADTKPTMSINGGTEFTPAWTAKTDSAAGTRTFYAQFMAAEDDFDEFGTVVVKYGEQTVLSQTLVTNSDPTP